MFCRLPVSVRFRHFGRADIDGIIFGKFFPDRVFTAAVEMLNSIVGVLSIGVFSVGVSPVGVSSRIHKPRTLVVVIEHFHVGRLRVLHFHVLFHNDADALLLTRQLKLHGIYESSTCIKQFMSISMSLFNNENSDKKIKIIHFLK